MAEYHDPGLVAMRCCYPQDHWEDRIAVGHREVKHDEKGIVWVPREHVPGLQKAGYELVL
jgi:hypothetical protein